MNILFFGKNSFSAQYLIKDLVKNNTRIFFFSRKPSTLKNNYIFEFTKRTELPKEIKNLKNLTFSFSAVMFPFLKIIQIGRNAKILIYSELSNY